MSAVTKRVRLKCRYEGEIRTVTLLPGWNFQQLKKRLSQDYGFEVSMKYEDHEGDLIILSSQNDFDDLLIGEPDTVNVHIFESTLPDLNPRGNSRAGGVFVSNIFPTNVAGSQSSILATTSSISSMGGASTPGTGLFGSNNLRLSSAAMSSARHVSSASTQNNHMMRMTPTARSQVDRFPQIDGHLNNGITDNAIRWKRGEILGQGAFGIVYLGLNTDTGELMAVKQMAMDEVAKKTLSSLENEIYFLRSLRHPNIVRYIDTEITTTALSIFLEYVPGGSLKSLVDKFGALEESVAKSYTRQLLLGLEYLHRNGIAHRDIKGGNCLVGNDGVVKLADFGNSKHWRPSMDPTGDGALQQVSGDIKGTPSWMAPEVIRDQGGAIQWKKADIWSLACTTIEMATGKPPWSQFNNSVTILYHIACQETIPEYPPAASMDLITFLNTCLQRDPTKRPDTTSLLLHPFVSTIGPGGAGWNNGTYGARPTTVSSALVENDWGAREATRTESRAESAARFSMSSRLGTFGGGSFTPGPGASGLSGLLSHSTSSNRLIATAASVNGSLTPGPVVPATGEIVNYSHSISMNPLSIPNVDGMVGSLGSPLLAEAYTLAECDDGEETPRLSRPEGIKLKLPTSGSTSALMRANPVVHDQLLSSRRGSDENIPKHITKFHGSIDESGDIDGQSDEIETLHTRNQWDSNELSHAAQDARGFAGARLGADSDDNTIGGSVIPIADAVISPPMVSPGLEFASISPAEINKGENISANGNANASRKIARKVVGKAKSQTVSTIPPPLSSTSQEIQQVNASSTRRKSGQPQGSNTTTVVPASQVSGQPSGSNAISSKPKGNRKQQNVGTNAVLRDRERARSSAATKGSVPMLSIIDSNLEKPSSLLKPDADNYAEDNEATEQRLPIAPKSCPPQVQSSKTGVSLFPFPSPDRKGAHRGSLGGDEDASIVGGITTTDYDEGSDGALGDNESYGSIEQRSGGKISGGGAAGYLQGDQTWDSCEEVDTDVDDDNLYLEPDDDADEPVPAEINEDTPEKLASIMRASRMQDKTNDDVYRGELIMPVVRNRVRADSSSFGMDSDDKDVDAEVDSVGDLVEDEIYAAPGESNVDSITAGSIYNVVDSANLSVRHVPGRLLEPLPNTFAVGGSRAFDEPLAVPGIAEVGGKSVRQGGFRSGASQATQKSKLSSTASATVGSLNGVALRRSNSNNSLEDEPVDRAASSGLIAGKKLRQPGKKKTTATQNRQSMGNSISTSGVSSAGDMSFSVGGVGYQQFASSNTEDGVTGRGPPSPLRHPGSLSGRGVYDDATMTVSGLQRDPENFDASASELPSIFDSFSPFVMEEHAGSITKLRCPGKTNLLVSGSNDGTLRVWNGIGDDERSRLIVDANNFSSGAVSTAIASTTTTGIKVVTLWAEDQCSGLWAACSDGGLRVWSGTDGKPIRYMKAHDDTINAIEGCVEGSSGISGSNQPSNLVGTGSSDKTVRLWDIRAKKPQVFQLRGHADAVVALRWVDGGRSVLSASRDKTVKIWDTRAGRLRVSLERHFGAVNALRAVGCNISSNSSTEKCPVAFVSAGRDSMINLWSDDGDCLGTLTAHRGTVNFLSEVGYDLQLKPNIAASSGSTPSPLMLSTGSDNTIKVWDLKRMRAASEIPVVGHGSLTKAVWAGQVIVACTNSGVVKMFQYCPISFAPGVGNIGNSAGNGVVTPGSPIEFPVGGAAVPQQFGDDSSVTSMQGGKAEWLGKDLATHAQACTDLISTPNFVASASKTGQIFRWSRCSAGI